MFFEAILLTVVAIFFANLIFSGNYTSIALLAFLTIGAVPLFNKLYSYDSYITNYTASFFARHKKIFALLFFFFLGILFTLITVHFVLNENTSDNLFSAQYDELSRVENINNSITGNFTLNDVKTSKFKEIFMLIFKNNLLVVFSAIVLSFFYGAGGLFLIAWNASLLAVIIINYISTVVCETGFVASLAIAKHGLIGFLGFIPHGFFEVLAYFIASVIGAVFARDLFKGIFSTPFKWHASRDLLYWFLLTLLCLLIGALIETTYFF